MLIEIQCWPHHDSRPQQQIGLEKEKISQIDARQILVTDWDQVGY